MSIVVKNRPAAAAAAQYLFSPIPACFRRPRPLPSDAPPSTTTSTSVYATDFGACVLTWTRTLLGRTLRIQLRDVVDYTLKIRSKPFFFWRNQGLKSFDGGEVQILWDFRRCGFGSETEAETGFYLAAAVGGELVLLVGDLTKPVYNRLRVGNLGAEEKKKRRQRLALRKEHVSGTRVFRASAGGRKVRILIEHFCSGRDSGLRVSFNGQCVLEVEHLVWKFRGSEQLEYEGACVNVSWDVYSWLFEDDRKSKKNNEMTMMSGVFVFDFEKAAEDEEDDIVVERKTRRSEMSSSLSSISTSSSSSVMDYWWSAEEMEMGGGGGGFSLVVYATKS